MRRVGFWELRENLDYGLDFMTTDQPMIKARVARVRLRLAFPVVWRYMNQRYDFTEEAVVRSRGILAAALDRIESERNGRDYLVGESFTVADLTASALLYPMVWPPEFPYDLPEPRRWEFLEPIEITRPSSGSREMWQAAQRDLQPLVAGQPALGPRLALEWPLYLLGDPAPVEGARLWCDHLSSR